MGLYILDEPEAALSPQRQMTLLCYSYNDVLYSFLTTTLLYIYWFMDKKSIKEFNNLAYNIICSRYRGVPYSEINEIATLIMKQMRNPQGNWQFSGEKTIDLDSAKSIIIEFYQSLDNSYISNKITDIIEGKDKQVNLSIKENYNVEPEKYVEPRVHTFPDGKQDIQMEFKGNIFDVFDLVHELAHTLDMPEGGFNTSRLTCAEITSICIEKIFENYVTEHQICSEKDVEGQKNNSAIRLYEASRDFAFKYAFMDLLNKNGVLTEGKIEGLLRDFGVSYEKGLKMLNEKNCDIHHSSKYVIGGIAGEQFENLYTEDRKKCINNFVRYISLIKQDKGYEAIHTLGVNLEEEGIKKVIEKMNSKQEEIHRNV